MSNDLGIFVDYSIDPCKDGMIEVMNLCTFETRSFTDITRAVDYAARHSNTLSPRYPAGYRSYAVRMIEALGMNLKNALMAMTPTEEIVLEGGCAPEYPDRLLPETVLRIAAKDYMLSALEANSETESLAWVDRARDLYNQANLLEESRADTKGSSEEADEKGANPYKHIGGRVIQTLKRKPVNRQALATDRRDF